MVDSGRALMFAGKNDSAYILYLAAINLLFRQNVGRGKEIVRAGMQQCRAHLLLLFSQLSPGLLSYLLKALEIAEQIDYRYAYPYIHAKSGKPPMLHTGRWEEGMAHQVKSIEAACAMGDTAMCISEA